MAQPDDSDDRSLVIELPASVSSLAIISDIHANLPALQAVLGNLEQRTVVCAGDLVGYYTEPNEVCALVRANCVAAIRGNHDAMVCGALAFDPGRDELYGVSRTREQLGPAQRAWLDDLPLTVDIHLRGSHAAVKRITVRHASPWDETTYLYPDTPLDRIALRQGEWLICGHTHHPMLRQAGEGWVLNPGSVGQPRNRNAGGACFAEIDLISGKADFRVVAYDAAAYQRQLAGVGVPDAAISLLDRARAHT
jgi:putative phosphoesterase